MTLKMTPSAIAKSAAFAFSQTFHHPSSTVFRRRLLQKSTPRSPNNTTIQSLPVELLVLIFKFVHVEWKEEQHEYRSGKDAVRVRSQHMGPDVMSPFQFPYAMAAVCLFWRNIASTIPQLWSHPVILLDTSPASLSTARLQLEWSSSLPLEILEISVIGIGDVFTRDVRPNVVALMDIINENIERVEALRFSMPSSIWLPLFPDDFRGVASNLVVLGLNCEEDDKIDDDEDDTTDSTDSTDSEREEFKCPNIRDLSINGRNLYNAFQNEIDLADMLPSVTHLVISHWTADIVACEQFTPHQLFRPLDSLMNLTDLSLADLDLMPNDDDDPTLFIGTVNDLFLENIRDSEALGNILSYFPWPMRTRITNCNFEDYSSDPQIPGVRLTLIEDENILPALLVWCGNHLVLDSCSGLSDTALAVMTKTQEGEFIYAEYLVSLHIFDCTNFSAAALKMFVHYRLEYETHEDEPEYCFREVVLSGELPDFSAEDISWFSDNVPSFKYHPGEVVLPVDPD